MTRQQKRYSSVFVAPIDVCGIYASLTRGLREIGCRADFLSLGADINGSWDEEQSDLAVRYFSRLHRRVAKYGFNRRSLLLRNLQKIHYTLTQMWLLIWVIMKYDVFVLKSGEFIGLWGFDIKALKFFRKKIVVAFLGSDSRPPFLRPVKEDETTETLLRLTRATQERVKRAENFADVILDNPLSSQNHKTNCCLFQIVGIVIDEKKLRPERTVPIEEERKNPDTIRIFHAASYPAIKGSDRIRACISNLVEKGYSIDYVEMTGRPNHEVLQEIVRSDIVIDQLYSDTDAATFATESCVLGKPVVVGGFGKKELVEFLPEYAVTPTVFVPTDDFESELEALIRDPDECRRAGKVAHAYFEDFGDSRAAAERLVMIAEGRAPEEWFFNPLDVIYVEGVGGERSKIAANIAKLVDAYGPEALMMDHHPQLRDALLAFMRQHGPGAQANVA